MRRPSFGDRTLVAVTMLLAALAALPVAVVVSHVLVAGAGDTWRHLASTVLPAYLFNTLVLFVAVGAGVGLIGTLTAWLVSVHSFPGSRTFGWMLLLPLAMPAYVSAYAYTDFLQFAGPLQTALRESFGWRRGDYWFPDVRSIGGAAAMFVFVLYPYVYLIARSAFLERSPSLAEAARILGYGRLQTFLRVELPLARPAIAGGIGLALMETLADYGTVAYFAVETFTTGIYRAWFSLGDRVAAAQLSAALLGFVALALLFERSTRGASGGPHGRPRQVAEGRPRPLHGMAAALAWLACALPVAAGFVVPALLLFRLLVGERELAASARFAELAWNTFRVAGITAVIALALAILVGYALRLRPTPAVRGGARLLSVGYAVPGSVLAVGVLIPLSGVDNAIASFVAERFGARPGLLLTGSIAALVYAYLVRYFTVGWNSVDAGFARITPSMDAAARSLGEGTVSTLLKVHLPLLRRSVVTGALLVFVDVMKELPATLVMRPFNFDTLATHAYTLAQDERLAEAALPSLAIVAVGLLPIGLMSRSIRRGAVGKASGGREQLDDEAIGRQSARLRPGTRQA